MFSSSLKLVKLYFFHSFCLFFLYVWHSIMYQGMAWFFIPDCVFLTHASPLNIQILFLFQKTIFKYLLYLSNIDFINYIIWKYFGILSSFIFFLTVLIDLFLHLIKYQSFLLQRNRIFSHELSHPFID